MSVPRRHQFSDYPDQAQWEQIVHLCRPGKVSLVIGILALIAALGFIPGAFSKRSDLMVFCGETASKFPAAVDWCLYTKMNGDYGTAAERRERCQETVQGRSTYEFCMFHNDRWREGLVIALLPGAIAILMLGIWLTGRSRTPKFIKLLRHRRQQIVWMYTMTVTSRGGATRHSIILRLENRGLALFFAPDGVEAADILANLATLAPWATLGYSDERKAAFARDPRALRRG